MYNCIFGLLFPYATFALRSIRLLEDVDFMDSIFTGSFIIENSKDSLLECASQCLDIYDCKTLFYHSTTLGCKLLSTTLNDSKQTTVSSGWKYFTAEPCDVDITVVGGTFVVPSNPVPAGDTLSYQCVVGFESSSSGTGGELTCNRNASWTEPSDPCQKCSVYSTNYEMRSGMYFFPPYPIMTWYPVISGTTSAITLSYCLLQCNQRIDFTCVAAYHKPGYCLLTWLRLEENTNDYSQYYYNETDYNEFIRRCQ